MNWLLTAETTTDALERFIYSGLYDYHTCTVLEKPTQRPIIDSILSLSRIHSSFTE